MPIGAPPLIIQKILDITEPPNNGFPANVADAANKWSDVADALLQMVIPPSTTAAAAKAAFIGVLSAASPQAGNGAALLDAAFSAYAATLAGGMAPAYVGAPPAAPPGFSALLTSPSDNAQAVAAQIAGLLAPWAITGQATLVAPPFTVSPWS